MRPNISITILIILFVGAASISHSEAKPSTNFYTSDDDIFDDWNVARTRSYGKDGFFQVTERAFRPVIAFESLGENINMAYTLGQEFREEYPEEYQRAEAIFYYVRDNVAYTTDNAQYKLDEYAQNADELAEIIAEKGSAKGDCEDMAVLLATMYKGAGYRSGIVLAPGHAAAIVYLPGYDEANVIFTFEEEEGWIWAEATGNTNPLGWVAQEVLNDDLVACEVTDESLLLEAPPADYEPVEQPQPRNIPLQLSPLFLVIMVFWLVPIFRRR